MEIKGLVTNLKGILYYLDEPLIDFEIKDRCLVKAKDLSNMRFYPPELKFYGVNYGNFNEFFNRRIMPKNCMFYQEHLKALNMDRFDIDQYIKIKNGNNMLDNYWIKFEDFGAKCFKDICN